MANKEISTKVIGSLKLANLGQEIFKVGRGIDETISIKLGTENSAATFRYNADANQLEFAPAGGSFSKFTSSPLGEVIQIPIAEFLKGFSIVHNLNGQKPQYLSIYPVPSAIDFYDDSFIVHSNSEATSKVAGSFGFVSFVGSKQSQFQAGTTVLLSFTVTGDETSSVDYNINGEYLRNSDATGEKWVRSTGGGFTFGWAPWLTSNKYCCFYIDRNNSKSERLIEISGKSAVINQPWTGVYVAIDYDTDSNFWRHARPVPTQIVVSNGSTSSTTLEATVGSPWTQIKVSGFGNDYDGLYNLTATENFGGPDNQISYSNGTRYLRYLVNEVNGSGFEANETCRWVFCSSNPYGSDATIVAYSEQTLQFAGVANLAWYSDATESTQLQIVLEESDGQIQVVGNSTSTVNGVYTAAESAEGTARIWSKDNYSVKYNNSQWELGQTVNSVWTALMFDVSGAADPWSGVFVYVDSNGKATNNTTQILYKDIASTALTLPDSELPETLKVTSSGGDSIILPGRTVASALCPQQGDLWANESSINILQYNGYRWEFLTGGTGSAPHSTSNYTLQWPDNKTVKFTGGYIVESYVSDAIVMSGLTSSQGLEAANGNYRIVDDTQTGTSRVWKHESQEYYVRNVYSQWVLTDSATSTSYNVYVQDYDGNNYQAPYDEETGDSYVWYYQGSELSNVEFGVDIGGKINFMFKASIPGSDQSVAIPYDGVYVRQAIYPGTDIPISYGTISDQCIWIRHSPYALYNENQKQAVWMENSAWKIGVIEFAADGSVSSKTAQWSIDANRNWPWKAISSYSGSDTLKMKKTKLEETPKIPQGVNIISYSGGSSYVGEYNFRTLTPGRLFPQEGDVFSKFEGTGRCFKAVKNSNGNLIWGLYDSPDGYYNFQCDAEWSWPIGTLSYSYYGTIEAEESTGVGQANIRTLPTEASSPSTFDDWGVYRRLEVSAVDGRTINFNYGSPQASIDVISPSDATILNSGLKVWVKASDWDAFNSSVVGSGVEVYAFVLGSTANVSDGYSGLYIDPAGQADEGTVVGYGYDVQTLYFGKLYKTFGTTSKGLPIYFGIKLEKRTVAAPQAYWPWESKIYYDNNDWFKPIRTSLEADPLAPPVALYVQNFHERSNGYYANRVINNEYTPTNGDRWRICGLDDSQFRQVDSVWYNGSKQRWEMYCWTGDSHQYAYSNTTTEKWPDDEGLLWYWGDRGYMSSNSAVENAVIERRTDEPISRYLTTKGLTLEAAGANYYFGQKLYSLRNSFNYEGQTPNLEDRFAIISTYDNAYRGSMEIRHDDSGYYWQIGRYVNNEYDSRLTKNVYCPPVATLEEMKWPWEVAEWACTHPGGGGGGVICAPLAFGVSDDDSITQAVGSYNSQTASGSAGYPGANSVWTCTTRDINVENLGTPTYYDRFISADGRAVVFLNADLGNINNGCRWIMRFPMYDDTGTTEDQYQRYYAAYRSVSMDQRSPKWPWEVAWETPNTSYYPNPAPSFTKGNGANGGLYWGDRVFVKAKNSADSYELPFLGGKQLPSVVNGTYAYKNSINDGAGTLDILPDFNGEFRLAPDLLTWEAFDGYHVVYKSVKTDRVSWYQDPDSGSSTQIGEDGAFGVILGKYGSASDLWVWHFAYFSFQFGGINHFPIYEHSGSVLSDTWTTVGPWEQIAVPGLIKTKEIVGSSDSYAVAAPNLVSKASDFWEGMVDGNAWSISWNSITKRYEVAVLGANFESNVIAVDESGNPKLFPWELTEEQWGAEFAANVEIGIEGSRFEVVGSDITGGYNEDHKRNTPANGLYFSRKFGGKFANSALAGENYDTYYIRRQTGTNSTDLREQGALKFVTEHEGGPQWRLATNPNSDKYVFALAQRSGDWRTPYADYASLKPPYDFENVFYSWYGNGYFGKIVPWAGYVIANGQRDYKTIPMFGARFTTNLKIDGVVDEIVDFVYDDSLEPLGDAPTANSRWKGTRNGASTVAAAGTEPTYLWSWDVDQKRWNLEITDEDGYGSIDITSVSESSAEPSLFPWEYKAYEFSGWSPGIVTGRMIESFIWQGSRIVVNGIAQYSGNGGHDVNGSYVSLHVDPENYAYDSTNKNWCWFNKFGCRFGRWNGSTGWALNSRDATFFSVSATNSSKLPWKDEDFSSNSSYNYGPSNFLVNGRAQDNPTGFTSAVDVIKCDADLKGRYVLVGYRTITADGGFEELVYRKADNGSKLVWNGSKWTLYGPDLTDWYVTSSSDQLRYPQDQNLTWEVGIAGEGSAANLPLIVAVPGETKLPKANKTVLNVVGAGIAEANGTYSPVDGADAFGSSMIWLKSDGTYKIWCNVISGAVANWLIGAADSITGKYLLLDPPGADGTISGPYNEDGSSKTWQTAAGSTDPAPTVTAVIVKDTITLSGASPDAINGTYELVDDSAEGDERIWTNGTYFVARGTSYTVWMVRNVTGRPSDPGSGGVYFYGSDTSKSNPYNDDGTSYDWYQMNGSGTLQVVKG